MAVYEETIELKDKVSGPAKKASGQVNELSIIVNKTRNIIQDSREGISSAISGIKNSITSLASGDVKGAVTGVAESIAGMAKLLDLAVPGLGTALSTIITIAGGLAGIAASLVKDGMLFAISANSAKQAMLSYFDAMGQGKVTGEQFEEMIDGVKAKLGISKDALVEWTKSLQAMGMTDLNQIENHLTTIASVSAMMGKTGEAAFLKLTKQINNAVATGAKFKLADKQIADLAKTGVNIVDVAKKMGMSVEDLSKQLTSGSVDAKKFGDALNNAITEKGKGPLEKMANSLPNLKKLLEESIGDLFEDIDVGPFLAQVKDLFNIFSQSTESGKALKAGVGGFFKKVFETATKVVPYIKRFFLDLVIWGLKAYIALKPTIKWFKELAANEEFMNKVKTAFKALGVTILFVVGLVALVVGIFAAFWAIGMAVGVAIWTVMGALISLGASIASFVVGWGAKALQWGIDFVMGIANGIKSGVQWVVDAVKSLAGAAKDAFVSFFKIGSPSKLMFGMGEFVGEGAAQGIESKQGRVNLASNSLGGAAVGGVTEGAKPSSGGSGGGVNVTVEAGAIVISGGSSDSIKDLTEEAVALIFERIALTQGL